MAMGLAEGIAAGCRHFFGLPARVACGIHLGRRQAHYPTGTPFVGRAGADLDSARRDAAILSIGSQCFLGRTQALGRPAGGISSGEHRTARASGAAIGQGAATIENPRCVAGGSHFRIASGTGRIGGMGFGVEKHFVGGFLSWRSRRLPGVRSRPAVGKLRAGVGIVHSGPDVKNGHRHPAGGVAGRLLVETGTVIVAAGRMATDSFLHRRGCQRTVYGVGGTGIRQGEGFGI